jgi:hypothetical protein
MLAVAWVFAVQGCAVRPGTAGLKSVKASEAEKSSGVERSSPAIEPERMYLPLREVAGRLIPADYGVRWVGVDATHMEARAIWRANHNWADALRAAVQSVAGLTVYIGHSSKLVLVQPLPSAQLGQAVPMPASASLATTANVLPAVASGSPAPARNPASQKGIEKDTAEKARTAGKLAAAASVPDNAKGEGSAAPLRANARPAVVLDGVFVSARRVSAAQTHWGLNEQDKTLRLALERWAENAGWRLFWELGVDYPITAGASLSGDFESAVSQVVRSLEQADVPPKAIFYRGNQVLRLVPRGME